MKLARISSAFALFLALAGCYPGAMDFNYYHNPVNVIAMASDAARSGDLDQWRDYFTGRAYCVYANTEGLLHVRRILTRHAVTKSSTEIDSIRLVASPNLHSVSGTKTEVYEVDVVKRNSRRKLFEVELRCEQTESQAFCKITKLSSPLSKDPDVGSVCDGLASSAKKTALALPLGSST